MVLLADASESQLLQKAKRSVKNLTCQLKTQPISHPSAVMYKSARLPVDPVSSTGRQPRGYLGTNWGDNLEDITNHKYGATSLNLSFRP